MSCKVAGKVNYGRTMFLPMLKHLASVLAKHKLCFHALVV
jgi:hypothetical protein